MCWACILAPGNQEWWTYAQRVLLWFQLSCPRPCYPGAQGKRALDRPWLQAEGGNQLPWWERLSHWSQELSVELSLSLPSQSWTKTKSAPKQQDHCPLDGSTTFWVCHCGGCVIILELVFVSRPDWDTRPVSKEAWESNSCSLLLISLKITEYGQTNKLIHVFLFFLTTKQMQVIWWDVSFIIKFKCAEYEI